ncbi:hypothetical protein SSBR45G_24060 [Bradyrhizobium sp. SSBR45G]|uniref:hypothetical protein n=1 Tax=unclassified Bradyrhizobium TaxID=2631580 RepID=UPI0023428C84|nr:MULTISPECIES: hypothetical protein [unclassified Bradyrhizobium]GLH77498.1 hypothetical protein SSBR45G_24060 [Bradyrhizobium sp. SSBR45G]GLH84396.1 hypothetical protein SSBR45R_18560 [Bradyrhizobium sp. SSBR45R]
MSGLIKRWYAVFIVDAIFKFLLLYGGAVLVSLGMIIMEGIEPVIYFSIVAAAMAVLTVMFLIMGSRLAALLPWPFMTRHPVSRTVVEIVCATAIFGAVMTLLFSLGSGFGGGIRMGLLLASTTLVSTLITVSFHGMARLVLRRAGQ